MTLPKGIHQELRRYMLKIAIHRHAGTVIRKKYFKCLDDAIEYRENNLDKVIW